MTLDPAVLAELVGGRPVTVVTGTNGKTTTTRLSPPGWAPSARWRRTAAPTCRPGWSSRRPSTADELVFEVDELYVPAGGAPGAGAGCSCC